MPPAAGSAWVCFDDHHRPVHAPAACKMNLWHRRHSPSGASPTGQDGCIMPQPNGMANCRSRSTLRLRRHQPVTTRSAHLSLTNLPCPQHVTGFLTSFAPVQYVWIGMRFLRATNEQHARCSEHPRMPLSGLWRLRRGHPTWTRMGFRSELSSKPCFADLGLQTH